MGFCRDGYPKNGERHGTCGGNPLGFFQGLEGLDMHFERVKGQMESNGKEHA